MPIYAEQNAPAIILSLLATFARFFPIHRGPLALYPRGTIENHRCDAPIFNKRYKVPKAIFHYLKRNNDICLLTIMQCLSINGAVFKYFEKSPTNSVNN